MGWSLGVAKPLSFSYWTSKIGACQKAAFCIEGSRIVTWQSYSPRGRVSTPKSKVSGIVPSRLVALGAIDFGGVSNSFFPL